MRAAFSIGSGRRGAYGPTRAKPLGRTRRRGNEMNQRKPKRSNPPGGKAGVIADIEERWFIPAPKVKRVMDGLVKVWKDALLRGEEVPMPGGVAQVTLRKPVCPMRFLDGGALLRGKKLEQLDLRVLKIKNPEKAVSFRANLQLVHLKDGIFVPRQVELDRSHRRAWKPGAPKPAMRSEERRVGKE